MLRCSVLITVLFVFNSSECARILAIFPTPSISHQVVFRPIVHELARRGHDVVLITPDPVFPKGKSPTNLTEIDVHDVSYKYVSQLLSSARGRKEDFMVQIKAIFEVMPLIFEAQLEVPEVKKAILDQRDTYDIVIVEACVRAGLGLSHIIKAPMIQISSLGVAAPQYAVAGSPIHPFLYPTPLQQRIYNLTLFEKLSQTFSFLYLVYLIYSTQHLDYQLTGKYFGDDMPSFEALFSNVKMIFINEHPLWADNRPVAPNILYIGGIHQTPDKPLPNDLKTYLDSSKNGVIYISFGSNVKANDLDPEKIKLMADVLSDLPYDVLWKWDSDKIPENFKNIKTSKWFPQTDVLKHPNVKVFVTQGGLQSTDEAINAAVPLIGIPMLADQWYNVEKYVRHKIGLSLEFPSLTAEGFKNALQSVIEDTSYKKNMIRLRSLMREYPVPPLDNAVWWIEHVIQHGGNYLQPPTAGMYSLIKYYEGGLFLTILSILLITLYLVLLLLRFIFKLGKKIMKRDMKIKVQ
ncbi:UDP-glucosyltransferase 2-like [Zerene cesonia]|uniref:UDP-glucosyltransferase 2-like n=1 Tax=Zerene cesonia TaxID=33412 RepID=UPI0018E4FC63|nr:UDP-glucosyltransferase 2-like [Zerene cesonia]